MSSVTETKRARERNKTRRDQEKKDVQIDKTVQSNLWRPMPLRGGLAAWCYHWPICQGEVGNMFPVFKHSLINLQKVQFFDQQFYD